MIFNSAILETLPGHELLPTEAGQYLLCGIHELKKEVEELQAEIRLLKGYSAKPVIRSVRLKKPDDVKVGHEDNKRAGSEKAHKTKSLTIHSEQIIEAEGVLEIQRIQ